MPNVRSKVKSILGIDAPDNPELIPEKNEEVVRARLINDFEKFEDEIKGVLDDYMSDFYTPGWRLK